MNKHDFFKSFKIALIHDHCLTKGGSERVFYSLINSFPDADFFAFTMNYESTHEFLKKEKIHTHPLGKFVKNHRSFKLLFPIIIFLMSVWDFSKYDLIITSSSTSAKYIKNYKGIHVCYCYTPTRALWFHNKYFKKNKFLFINILFTLFIKIFQKIDLKAAQNIDYIISISKITKNNIKKLYNRSSKLIYSPISNTFFSKSHKKFFNHNYFLLISRLEYEKNINHIIETFNNIDRKLYIIGDGYQKKELQKLSGSNITFLGSVDDNTLIKYLSSTQALIYPTELEYGLVPIEANALGVPVIAYGKGGVKETMRFNEENPHKNTAIFYKSKNPKSLQDALKKFDEAIFDSNTLKKNASRFSEKIFIRNIQNYIKSILLKH